MNEMTRALALNFVSDLRAGMRLTRLNEWALRLDNEATELRVRLDNERQPRGLHFGDSYVEFPLGPTRRKQVCTTRDIWDGKQTVRRRMAVPSRRCMPNVDALIAYVEGLLDESTPQQFDTVTINGERIRAALNITSQQLYDWQNQSRDPFPAPVSGKGRNRAWNLAHVNAWLCGQGKAQIVDKNS